MSNPIGFILPLATIGLGSLLIKPVRGFFPQAAPAVPGQPAIPVQRPLIPQVTIEETGVDTIRTTDHPVERGATITDHTIIEPVQLTIRCAWSNSPSAPSGIIGQAVSAAQAFGGVAAQVANGVNAALTTVTAVGSILSGNAAQQVSDLYKQLLDLQKSRVLCTIGTGKRSYSNMILTSVTAPINAQTENSLVVYITAKQIIIVSTRVVTIPINSQECKDPAKVTPTQDLGPQQPQNTTSFIPPEASLSGSMLSLAGNMTGVTSLFAQLPGGIAGATGSIAGALGQLPGLLMGGLGTVQDALKAIPLPLEIPTIPSPQSFSIPLGAAISPDVTSALTALTPSLGSMQVGISAALQQLPSALPSLPPSFSTLGPMLTAMQGQIDNVLVQNADVLARSVVPPASDNQMNLAWNVASQAWKADISDGSGNPIVQGIPLVTGANLVEQFGHLGFSGQFITQTDHAIDAVPNFANLGTSGHLYLSGP